MRLLRDLREYAEARGITYICREQVAAELIEKANDQSPLHTRGYKRRPFGSRWSGDPVYKNFRSKKLRRLWRREQVEAKMKYLSEEASERFNLPGIDTMEAWCATQTRDAAAACYSNTKEAFPLYLGAGNATVRIGVGVPAASFRRGTGLTLTVSERSLRYDFKRIYSDSRCAVIIDYLPVLRDIAYIAWATRSKKNNRPLVYYGALCDGALIPGYKEGDIREQAATIRMQAKLMETNRALGIKP